MQYKSIRIQNFKGIKDTTINIGEFAGAGVFAFVGLNESGKTTILQAIHSFSPDNTTSQLLSGAKKIGVPISDRVPRNDISTFTGDVTVTATLTVSSKDKNNIIDKLRSEGIKIDESKFPDEVIFERINRFNGGDHVGDFFNFLTDVKIKTKNDKKFKSPNEEQIKNLGYVFYGHTPDIAYFPTFVFDFPEKVKLTPGGSEIDNFYKNVFQDVLDFVGKGHDIEKDIIRRIRGEVFITNWADFASRWFVSDDKAKVDHVLSQASAALTKMIFGKWNAIFGEDASKKEIRISQISGKGSKKNEAGGLIETNEHDLFIKFEIEDGTRSFNVNDRSLGFRWFFAFMLFTQFRVSSDGPRPVLFLFDEPASNLHAAAQKKLIESFPEIAIDEHCLAYTTHSHYMIEPKWLEQTFIVTNRSDSPVVSMIENVYLPDESLDIKAETYRNFVNKNPSQISYFQPILDRLDVVPSHFDFDRPSVVVEGKSDYYILRYGAELFSKVDFYPLPALGATTFGALSALGVGWDLNFIYVLDQDKGGSDGKKICSKKHGVPEDRIFFLSDLLPDKSDIESLLDSDAREFLRKELRIDADPSKAEIVRFFQERLAAGRVESISAEFDSKISLLIDQMQNALRRDT